jgi:hypothetical protein
MNAVRKLKLLDARGIAAVGLLLVAGAAGCGDSDNDSASGSNGGGSQTERAADTGSAADRKEVAAIMPRLREQYNSIDGKAFCAELTPGGQKEVKEWGATVKELKAKNCEQTIARYARVFVKASRSPQTPVRLKGMEIDGDKATVTLNGGLAGIRSTATYKLAKTDGKWKLVNPISGANTRVIE